MPSAVAVWPAAMGCRLKHGARRKSDSLCHATATATHKGSKRMHVEAAEQQIQVLMTQRRPAEASLSLIDRTCQLTNLIAAVMLGRGAYPMDDIRSSQLPVPLKHKAPWDVWQACNSSPVWCVSL